VYWWFHDAGRPDWTDMLEVPGLSDAEMAVKAEAGAVKAEKAELEGTAGGIVKSGGQALKAEEGLVVKDEGGGEREAVWSIGSSISGVSGGVVGGWASVVVGGGWWWLVVVVHQWWLVVVVHQWWLVVIVGGGCRWLCISGVSGGVVGDCACAIWVSGGVVSDCACALCLCSLGVPVQFGCEWRTGVCYRCRGCRA